MRAAPVVACGGAELTGVQSAQGPPGVVSWLSGADTDTPRCLCAMSPTGRGGVGTKRGRGGGGPDEERSCDGLR